MAARVQLHLSDGTVVDELLNQRAIPVADVFRVALQPGQTGSVRLWTMSRHVVFIRVEDIRQIRIWDDDNVPLRQQAGAAPTADAAPLPPIDHSGQRSRSVVYFVQSEATGRIKIGRSRDVKTRIASLRIGNGSEVKLLATVPGGRGLEREYHERFASHRVFGEWFDPAPELLTEVSRLAQGPVTSDVGGR